LEKLKRENANLRRQIAVLRGGLEKAKILRLTCPISKWVKLIEDTLAAAEAIAKELEDEDGTQ